MAAKVAAEPLVPEVLTRVPQVGLAEQDKRRVLQEVV
jgi:hypothetical protein